MECRHHMGKRSGGLTIQKSDQRHRLLRARRTRPRNRRAPKEREEIAPTKFTPRNAHHRLPFSPSTTPCRRSDCYTLTVAQAGMQVLGVDLKCSEYCCRPSVQPCQE